MEVLWTEGEAMRLTTIRGNAIITVRAEQRIGLETVSLEAYASTTADAKLLRLARRVVLSSMIHRIANHGEGKVAN